MIYPRLVRCLATGVFFLTPLAAGQPDADPVTTPPSKLLVVGFLGGRVASTNAIHQEVHIEIESDPKIWNRVESLVRSKIGAVSN